ncbi:MAG: DUF4105 domain-containing protein [Bacteroidales bacterium]|nr:DUF4105 domain-containing protein [Candidatus Sodaliphilus fimicaballi]
MKKSVFVLIVAILAMCMPQHVHAQEQQEYVLLPDSSNFVKASLVVVSPGEEIYSSLGHCAIRLECPIHKLDYCFSFMSMGATSMDILQFFAGELNVGFCSFPTQVFLADYAEEGREVKQVELNLTLHEQQRLWQLLDEDLVDGDKRRFNYLQNNCSSMSLCPLEWSLIDEQLSVNKWPEPMLLMNGDGVRYLSRNTPWLKFLNMTLLGAESDTYWPNEQRISPELIMEVLNNSTINPNDGSPARPVFKSAPATILPLKYSPKPTPITPIVAFLVVLALVVLVTALQLAFRLDGVGRVVDVVLFSLQSIAGLLLLYMSTVTCLFGLHWNWYLIVFNPLPLVLWIAARKKSWYSKVYLVYTVVLLGFLCLWPVSSQFDWDHQLLTITLAVRTAYNYYATLKPKKQ